MLLKKRLQSHALDHGDMVIKALSLQILPFILIGSQIMVVILSTKVSLFPSEDVMFSIVSTFAEIIAGLYGITTAGYTFFLSRIDALMASDATLDYIVKSIKNRYKHLIWYITGAVLMTLLISLVLMYSPVPTEESSGFFYRLFCNEFVLFVVYSVALILIYSLLVIDPNSIEKEARKLKRKLGGRLQKPGSAAEFIALYDQIEESCNAMLPKAVLRQLHDNKGKHFELTLELLQEQNLILLPVMRDQVRIHRYYECMINTSPMEASQEMCMLAQNALSYLRQVSGKTLVKQ